MTIAAIFLFTCALAWLERRPDPIRFGAAGTWSSLISALALLAVTLLAIATPDPSAAIPPLGALLATAGIALRVLAARALGEALTSETVLVPGRPLVTRGIYAHVRHPSDAGLVAFAAGLALLAGSAFALAVVVIVLFPSVVVRVLREERLLYPRTR